MVGEYNPKKSNKFLVYRSNSGGFGDRMFGAISTFILAYVNDYQFRIENFKPISFVEVFTSPYRWWEQDWKGIPMKRGRLNIESSYDEYSDIFTTGTIEDHYPKSDCISVYSNQNFIKHIFKNPIYKSKLEKEGITEDNVFQYAINFLFDLEDEYKKNFLYLKHKLLLDSNHLVGVHLRTNWNWGDVPEITDSTVDRFVQAIEMYAQPKSRILLCTDHTPLIEIIKQRLPQYEIKTVKGEPVHLQKNENHELRDILKIVYEIWLLADSDVFIGSYWSNFTRIPVLKSLKKPVLVELEVKENGNDATKYWLKNFNHETYEEEYRLPVSVRGVSKFSPVVLNGIK